MKAIANCVLYFLDFGMKAKKESTIILPKYKATNTRMTS